MALDLRPEACSEEVEISSHNGQRCRAGFRGPRPRAAQGRGELHLWEPGLSARFCTWVATKPVRKDPV